MSPSSSSSELSLFELPPDGSGLDAQPGRPSDPDRPTSTDLVAPSRSPSRPSRPESLQVARPSRFERPKSIEKVARTAPRRNFRRFWLDFGTDFSGFSRLHRASDSTRSAKGRTSVFAGRRSTFKGSQTSPKKRKSTKIDEKLLRRCFANALHAESSIFPFSDATWRRFWSPRRAPRRSRAPFLACRVALGDSPGPPGERRGRSVMLPRHSRDAPETLPRRLRDALRRHGVSGEGPGTDFQSILGAPRCLPGSIFDRFSP